MADARMTTPRARKLAAVKPPVVDVFDGEAEKPQAKTKAGSRTRKAQGTGRATRSRTQVKGGDRQLSDQERMELWNAQFYQDVLPNLPPIPGYHVCWLTTTNPRDSIPMRMRLGYTPVMSSEVPGYEHAAMKSGEFAGMIKIEEMVAFKIPIALYQYAMTQRHVLAPNREEQKLKDTADSIRENAARQGGKVIPGNGMNALGRNMPRDDFSEISE